MSLFKVVVACEHETFDGRGLKTTKLKLLVDAEDRDAAAALAEYQVQLFVPMGPRYLSFKWREVVPVMLPLLIK